MNEITPPLNLLVQLENTLLLNFSLPEIIYSYSFFYLAIYYISFVVEQLLNAELITYRLPF
jgi:hypothetical protein